jgi:WD40 repeat protein
VWSVAFSPDGKYIASGSDDKTVKLWSIESQKKLATLQGHLDTVSSIAFSSDGKCLASGSYDNTAKLWSVES